MRKICLLGPNSGIGKVILKHIAELPDTTITKVVRQRTTDENEVFWDYASCPPDTIVNADIVINCARSSDFAYNVRFNSILYKSLSQTTKFINFSSNCIYARPNGWFSNLLFAGDAYIREKKAIEKMNTSPNHFLIRPTIVVGESSWDAFLSNVKNAQQVFVTSYAKNAQLKIITTEEVALAVRDLIRDNFAKQFEGELYTKVVAIHEFLDNEITFSDSKAVFFDSMIKNLLLHFLTARFLPTPIVFRLQRLLIKGNTKAKPNAVCQNLDLTIEGMTRLYLCGKHTL